MKVVLILCTLFYLSQAVPASLGESSKLADPSYKRIVNGKNANAHEWPWMVSLQLESTRIHRCGGSILTKDWVLTAARCLVNKSPSEILVVVGEHDRNVQSSNEKTHEVAEILTHPNFERKTAKSDVALVRLKTSITLNDKAKTIQLPKQGDRDSAGKSCFATGWGRTIGVDNSSRANILQEAELKIADDETCFAHWPKWFDKATMVCAGAEGNSICRGDIGGAFSCLEEGKWVLRGVISWAEITECMTNRYSVFARVSTFTDWINKNIGR